MASDDGDQSDEHEDERQILGNDEEDDSGRQKTVADFHPRGLTKMKRVLDKRRKSIKFHVRFNEQGQPVGEEAKKLAGFIGLAVRQQIPITISNWKYVDKREKNAIWSEMLVRYYLYKYV